MKKIFFIFILFLLIIYKNAECQLGYFSYSYSHEFINGASINNHSLGYETAFPLKINFTQQYTQQWISIFIKGVNNNPAIELKYEIDYYCYEGNSSGFSLGPGLNLSYNFSENLFGISPQFDFMYTIGHGWLKFNLIYRYNIYINKKNTHEIGFTFGLLNFPTIFF